MNKLAWIAALAATMALSGCGGNPADTRGGPAADDAAVENGAVENGDGAQAQGAVDCSGMDTETLAVYSLYAQIFAQVTNVDQMTGFELVDYSPEKFDEALDKLEPLRAVGPGQFGDPGEALDFYRATNAAAAELVSKGDAVTQADVDVFAAQAGGAEKMIEAQMAINVPLSENCPDLD